MTRWVAGGVKGEIRSRKTHSNRRFDNRETRQDKEEYGIVFKFKFQRI